MLHVQFYFFYLFLLLKFILFKYSWWLYFNGKKKTTFPEAGVAIVLGPDCWESHLVWCLLELWFQLNCLTSLCLISTSKRKLKVVHQRIKALWRCWHPGRIVWSDWCSHCEWTWGRGAVELTKPWKVFCIELWESLDSRMCQAYPWYWSKP